MDLQRLASDECTYGFSGSDLNALCSTAALYAARESRTEPGQGAGTLKKLRPLTEQDFLKALHNGIRTEDKAQVRLLSQPVLLEMATITSFECKITCTFVLAVLVQAYGQQRQQSSYSASSAEDELAQIRRFMQLLSHSVMSGPVR